MTTGSNSNSPQIIVELNEMFEGTYIYIYIKSILKLVGGHFALNTLQFEHKLKFKWVYFLLFYPLYKSKMKHIYMHLCICNVSKNECNEIFLLFKFLSNLLINLFNFHFQELMLRNIYQIICFEISQIIFTYEDDVVDGIHT